MSQIDNRRIAKNTLMLYGRTLLVMVVSLFTSRVTLQALGVDNYGINSAVGGVITMFSIVSGSLSSSISRFITFELGHGNIDKLKRIFCTAINIQLAMGVAIIILGETLGVWFLNTQMNIPEGRMTAANWVLQCAIWSFFIGLTQTPYGACIVGHEKMSVFAYFSLAETFLKLIIVYLLYVSPFDKLITLSVLGFIVSLLMRIAQRIYCAKTFEECHYRPIMDKALLKEMSGFAGWSFLTNTAWIFNTQGINILINIFFGVAFNAARGIAASLEGIVKRFTSDFTTALNPQITKSYAAGELVEMNKLICRGSRFTYYLMFMLSLPFMYEAYYVLYLWLGQVPEYTVTFFRLSIICTFINMLGNTGYIGCMATGKIKWYTITMTSIGFIVFPFTWICFKMGMEVEWAYYTFIIIYILIFTTRLFFMRHLWGFPITMFMKETMCPIILVTLCSVIVPSILYFFLSQSMVNAIIIMIAALTSSIIFISTIGLKNNERKVLFTKATFFINQKILHKS